MSSAIFKKLARTPVRSPSPDFANNNHIVSTSSPINEVARRLRADTAHIPQTGKLFPEYHQQKRELIDLQEKNRKLSRQNSQLQLDNRRYIQQIDFLKEMNLKSQSELLKKKSSEPISYQSDRNRQYQVKIQDLVLEVKRIQELLTKEIKHNEILIRQNQAFKRQAKQTNQEESDILRQKIAELQQNITEILDRQLLDYQGRVDRVMNDLIRKITRVENQQIILGNKLQNKRKTLSPHQGQRKDSQNLLQEATPPIKVRQFKETTGQTYKNEQSSKSAQPFVCQTCILYRKQIQYLTSLPTNQPQATQNGHPKNEKYSEKRQSLAISQAKLKQYMQQIAEIKLLLVEEQQKGSKQSDKVTLNELQSIDQRIELMIDQKNSIIQELKQKEIQLNIEIIGLKKEMNILKVQTKEQNDEIVELKAILSEKVQSFKRLSQPFAGTKNQASLYQADILRKYLQEVTQKIQNLESQIGNSLKQ